MNAEKRIGLAELIGDLRKELIKAQLEGSEDEIRFLLEEVEVEVEVASAKKATGEAGVEFWVVNTKAEGETSTESVQTLKLKLKPKNAASRSQSNEVFINRTDGKPKD